MMPSYRNYKKKENNKEEKNSTCSVFSSNGAPNYKILSNREKPETSIDFKKIPETKSIIEEILKKDMLYWKSLKEPTQGIEKYNLLNKVCDKLPINSNVFEMALDELIVEQIIVPMELDNKIRFLMLCL